MVSQDTPVRELDYEIRWLTPGFQQLPPATTLELAGVPCVVEKTRLVARPPLDRSDLDEVRTQLQDALDTWALELELKRGWRVAFRLTGTAWDDPPVPGQPRVFRRGLHSYLSTTASVSAIVQASLPAPAGDVALTREVTPWLERLRGVREGREPAPSASYALLSDLEQRHGSRSGVATTLHVSRDLLTRIGTLASGYHPTKGRKTEQRQQVLTDADLAWLESAMALLVRRLAELAAAPATLSELTVADVS